jgi:uncharacterized protein
MKLHSHLLALSLVLVGSIAVSTTPSAYSQSAQSQATQTAQAQSRRLQPGINRVTFQSEGETLVGNLYLPTNYKFGDKLPTVVIAGSWTTVKEQMSASYAQKLAAQGFAALAFDFRSFGESGGKLRSFESPTAKIADLKNALTFLQTVNAVDRNRIAGLGICAGAGYVTTLAATDSRLKAVVTVAPWLHNPDIVNAVYGGKEQVAKLVQTGRNAEANFAKTGKGDYVLATSKTDKTAVMYGDIDYYQNPQRGAIPQWNNRFAVATWAEWLTFNPLPMAQRITVPTLFIHSEKAAIPDGARQFFAAIPATTPKKFAWLPDRAQFDFYDQAATVDQSIALTVNHLRSAF